MSRGSGEVTFSVSNADINGLEILLIEAVFSRWAEAFWLEVDPSVNPDVDPYADPDGDGYANFEEFAFGTDPTEATPALTSIFRDGPDLTLSWLERTDGIACYFVRNSKDLLNWPRGAGCCHRLPVARGIRETRNHCTRR